MTLLHYWGATVVLFLFICLGLISAKKASVRDFSGNRNSNSMVVIGALVGTLVGGSSTIGTAQLAYSYGLSAWWFTLGGGIAVVVLGLVYKKNFYEKELNTIPELISMEYGKNNATIITVLNSIGTFLSIVAQIISANALLTSISQINSFIATITTVLLILCYVVLGGALSLGYAGTLKTVLLSVSTILCGLLALVSSGGVDNIVNALEYSRYFSLLARGPMVDLGAGFSLIVGVITTQSYVSAIVMSKDNKALNKSTITTALIVPIIGIAGILVGMYMKINYPGIDSKMALPLFIINKVPDFIGGIILGTLFIAVVGTAAGLSFGMAKMFATSFFSNKKEKEVFVIRFIIIIILVTAAILSYGKFGQYILSWSFLSMALRGATAFVPVLCALFLPSKIDSLYASLAIIIGPTLTFVGKFILPASMDSLFLGVLGASLIMGFGFAMKKVGR